MTTVAEPPLHLPPGWRDQPDEWKQLFAERLRIAAAARAAELRRAESEAAAAKPGSWDTPSALATSLFPGYVPAPHLTPIDEAFLDADSGKVDRILLCTPPQVGKSTTAAEAGPLWWLSRHRSARVTVASYALKLAARRGQRCRDMIKAYGQTLGLDLTPGSQAVAEWDLASGGGMICTGVEGGLTGFGSDMMVIDDPHKNREEANSETIRKSIEGWYQSTVETRMAPGAPVILIMCMTGDTPVLMADGTEQPLRDVRPGDVVATYEDGALATATVRNWANQGPDSVYAIRMRSGRVVRANARHPFLTVAEGAEIWQRTDQLKPGDRIRLATGASTAASSAPQTDVTPRLALRACACRTTTGSAGPPASAPRPSTPRPAAVHGCCTATGSPSPSTTAWSPRRAASAPSASSHRRAGTPARTGTESSASTIAMTPAAYADCSATTATLPSATARPKPPCGQPLTTYAIEADEVLEVLPCGIEDVYDVQIDRTENFIANGLVSHNTRWHKADLAAFVLRNEGRIEDGGRWKVVSLPAIAEGQDDKGQPVVDPLGRAPGDPLTHPKLPGADRETLMLFWQQKRNAVGSREWPALYQQRPSDPEGTVWRWDWIDAGRLRPEDLPELGKRIVAVDPSATDKATSDACGIVVCAKGAADRQAYVLDDVSKIATPLEWGKTACRAAILWECTEIVAEGTGAQQMITLTIRTAWRQLIEEAHAAGTLQHLSPDLPPRVVLVQSRVGKRIRAEPVAALYETAPSQVHHVGDRLGEMETEQTGWNGEGKSPNRLDALVHGVTYLMLRPGGPSRSESVGDLTL